MQGVVGRLEAHLRRLDLEGYSARQVTHMLTQATVDVLESLEIGRVRLEEPCPRPVRSPTSGKLRSGRLDVALVEDQRILVAVEIDRANKQFSKAKLLSLASDGVICIWVRWKPLRSDPGALGLHVIALGGRDAGTAPHLRRQPNTFARVQEEDEVTVWLSEPLWGRDPRTEEMIQSNRHVVAAHRVIQDAEQTLVIDLVGEVLLEFPTVFVERISWGSAPARQAPSVATAPKDETGFRIGSKDWREHISKENPRAYEPWTEDEDEQLRREAGQHLSKRDMSRRHQRRVGAIEARLKKLGLD